jgi:mono/diheme cytochrome c family protein
MKTAIRWLLYAVGGLAAVTLAAAPVVYVASERILERRYPAPAGTIAILIDPGSLREGERLARLYTCMGGCHGPDGAGSVMFDDPLIGRVVAPNLHDVVHRSDTELVAAIRHGIGPDGRSLLVMPSEAFALLTDEDLGRIIAYLRSLPPTPGPQASVELGPLGRIGMPRAAATRGNGLRPLPRTQTTRRDQPGLHGARPRHRQRVLAGGFHAPAAHRRGARRPRGRVDERDRAHEPVAADR